MEIVEAGVRCRVQLCDSGKQARVDCPVLFSMDHVCGRELSVSV